MERPNSPSVPMSEPEAERRMVEGAIDDMENNRFGGMKIHLQFAGEYLREHGLDVDEDGFIIKEESGEHAVPYVFVDDLVKEYVKDEDESVFDAFFRPVTDERVHGWDMDRLHLSDLHAILTTENGEAHPVRDDVFDLADFHARLKTAFRVITGWSDLVKRENIDDSGRWIAMAKESENPIDITCSNPKCGFCAKVSEWDGEENSPVCPDCGGKWDDADVTVCTVCDSWYWGTYFEGESMYAEPVCANCGEDMEYLEKVSRYDDADSLEAVAEKSRPKYTVVGVNLEGDVVYMFDHTETWEEAVEEREFSADVASGSVFEEVESVSIYERDELDGLERFTRTDDQV